MKLTEINYHADRKYLSSSFIKSFIKCEYGALYERTHPQEDKTCFKEGRLFETLVSGTQEEKEKFIFDNPDIVAKTGKNKGQLKSNFSIVKSAANKVIENDFLKEIIDNSKKQIIFTGKIADVPMKMMCDLLYKDGSIYDLKCMANFKDSYNAQRSEYETWYQSYNYHIQMYIYKTIAEQNGLKVPNVGLISASKEDVPEIKAIKFSDDWLKIAENETLLALERYKNIVNGDAEPVRCEMCNICKATRIVDEFEVV